jgi:hypothetical protein
MGRQTNSQKKFTYILCELNGKADELSKEALQLLELNGKADELSKEALQLLRSAFGYHEFFNINFFLPRFY